MTARVILGSVRVGCERGLVRGAGGLAAVSTGRKDAKSLITLMSSILILMHPVLSFPTRNICINRDCRMAISNLILF